MTACRRMLVTWLESHRVWDIVFTDTPAPTRPSPCPRAVAYQYFALAMFYWRATAESCIKDDTIFTTITALVTRYPHFLIRARTRYRPLVVVPATPAARYTTHDTAMHHNHIQSYIQLYITVTAAIAGTRQRNSFIQLYEATVTASYRTASARVHGGVLPNENRRPAPPVAVARRYRPRHGHGAHGTPRDPPQPICALPLAAAAAHLVDGFAVLGLRSCITLLAPWRPQHAPGSSGEARRRRGASCAWCCAASASPSSSACDAPLRHRIAATATPGLPAAAPSVAIADGATLEPGDHDASRE